MGIAQPDAPLLVSPDHRIVLQGRQARDLFNCDEVLVAAKHLTVMEGVDIVQADSISYIHLMFDHHEVILGDGTWTESFQPGDMSLRGIGSEQRQEILSLFTRRINERIPACYLTGEAWFTGLSFKSDPHALVPRSPIAELIEEADLQHTQDLGQWR